MAESFGVEKSNRSTIDMCGADLLYQVVTGDEILCFCFSEEDAQKIMYALNRKK